jgi:hypothetical protein
LKQIDFKEASGMINFFSWKLSEWIRDRFERTVGDLTLWMKSPVKAKTFINSLGRFFHYEPLSTSFIRLWRDLSAKI